MAAKDPTKSTYPTATATAPSGSDVSTIGADIVKIRHPVRGQDASGARVVAYQDWEPDIVRGSFVTIASNAMTAASIHQNKHEGELFKYKFGCSIKLHYRDQILWLSQGEIYTVIRVWRNKDDSAVWDHLVADFTA